MSRFSLGSVLRTSTRRRTATAVLVVVAVVAAAYVLALQTSTDDVAGEAPESGTVQEAAGSSSPTTDRAAPSETDGEDETPPSSSGDASATTQTGDLQLVEVDVAGPPAAADERALADPEPPSDDAVEEGSAVGTPSVDTAAAERAVDSHADAVTADQAALVEKLEDAEAPAEDPRVLERLHEDAAELASQAAIDAPTE